MTPSTPTLPRNGGAGFPLSAGEVDNADRLAWVRAGIAALEARLDAHDRVATPEERAMLVTLLMSLEETISKMETQAPALPSPAGGGGTVSTDELDQLKLHLDDIGARVRTRVVYSGAGRKQASPLLRVVPWVASAPAAVGNRLHILSRGLTALGVLVSAFLVFEFALTSLVHDRAQQDLLAGFRQAIQTTTLDAPTATPAEGSPVALLDIPRIGLNEVVVEGSTPNDLKSGPGHLRSAPLPGEFGNAVIAGRRTTYGAPFRNLNQLRVGDAIQVTTGQGAFFYIVSGVHSVPAGQGAPLTGTLDDRLTLVTSDPAFMPSSRLVVVAKLAPLVTAGDPKGTPIAVAGRPPVAAGISELGLAGDPLGLILALIFGQLLIAAVWATTRMARRWPLSMTLLLATPVLLALTVLFFSNLDQLLPGML